MPNLIAENERVNGHLTNAKFAVGDATELELPAGSVDVLFSNWLLMYLGDEEVSSLATRALSWVVPGGVVFFRESCFRQSGDKQRAKNPTHYRDPREYFRLFDDARGVAADGVTKVRFELVTCRCVDTYVRLKQNQNQLCWKWRVVRVEEEGDGTAAAGAAVDDESSSSKGSTPVDAPATPSRRTPSASSLGHASTSSSCAGTPRHFLDAEQYSAHSIARYERVFGRGFVTSGGEASTRALLLMFSPALQQKKQKLKDEKVAGNNPFVLDIGSGLGGAAAILAADYNCRVRGIDLSVNMVSEKVFFEFLKRSTRKRKKTHLFSLLSFFHSQNQNSNQVLSAMDRHNAAAAAEDGGASAKAAAALARFEVGDATRVELEPQSFDAVHSRDTLLHIEDKALVLRKAFDALRPGGMILLTDYLKAPSDEEESSSGGEEASGSAAAPASAPSETTEPDSTLEFSTYVSKRGYHLWDLPTYSAALQETGFADVVAEDRTGAFEACLKSELEKAEADREAFVRDFSEEDFEEVVGAWRAKLTRVAKGQQRWGLFVARKPL